MATEYIYTFSMTAPAALVEDAQRLAWALGHDEPPLSAFSAALSPTGQPPATHYGLNTAATQAFVDVVMLAKDGHFPPLEWEDYGLTESRVRELMEAMEVEITGSDVRAWDALLDRLGLMTVRTEEA